MAFNPNKTEAILFTLRHDIRNPKLIFNDTVVKFVKSHKHLDVTSERNGQWHEHIVSIIKSVYKIVGIMRKLKYSFSRQALNQMYISYIWPILEYYSILWDGTSIRNKDALENLLNEAARFVTGLTRSTTDRRQFQKLCFIYKCTNSLVREHISDLILPFVREVSNYPLRNRDTVSSIYTRTEIFSRSCLPSGVTLWDSLDTSMKHLVSFVGL